MNKLKQAVLSFVRSDDGPTATEYAVILAVISMGVIVAMGAFGLKMGNIYTAVTATLDVF